MNLENGGQTSQNKVKDKSNTGGSQRRYGRSLKVKAGSESGRREWREGTGWLQMQQISGRKATQWKAKEKDNREPKGPIETVIWNSWI